MGPKVKTFFEILWFYWIHPMILEKMRSCLWKLEPGFLTNGLISLLSKALGPNVRVLGSVNFFMSSSIKFCFKKALIFKFWVTFDKVMSVYSQKIAKKPSKIFFLVPFQIFKFPLKPCLKNLVFLSTKIQISPEPLGQIKKMSPFWNLLIKGFQMM